MNAVKALAQPEASQVDLLQQQIDALQSLASVTYNVGFTTNSQLDEINQKEADLRKQEQENADKLNKTALDYYTWAQGTAQDAEQKRHDELMGQLEAITGGMDVNAWIAQETSREVDLLQSIDDQLKAFLDSISSNVTAGSGNQGTGTGGGNGGGNNGPPNIVPGPPSSGNTSPFTINVNTTINGTGMGSQDIAAAVNDGLRDALPAAVPSLKRLLKVG